MGETTADVRAAVLVAFDSGNEAQALLLPMLVDVPDYRLSDFFSLRRLGLRATARAELAATDYEAQGAAEACGRFAKDLDQLLRVFPDRPLARAAEPGHSWRERVWSADGPDAVAVVRAELDEAMTVVLELLRQLNLGRALVPRTD